MTLGLFALGGAAASAVAAAWRLETVAVVLSPLAGWALGRLAARSFTAPLEHLAATAASFAAGNLEARADTAGPREVRLVAQSFNRMASEVATALEQVTNEERRKSQFVSDVSH